ncbi:MAG: GH3 auxin-responsive promoter family protein [Rhodospirillales bacterium]
MLNLTPIFSFYARYRMREIARLDAVAAQERELRRLVAHARSTRFGSDHHFSKIRTVEDYQKRVPIRAYEDFWKDYWQQSFPRLNDCTWPGTIPYFALTSGTTSGVTKFIPCSPQMIASNRRAMLDVVAYHLARRPDSRLFAGRSFMLGGSANLRELSAGIWAGDLSGIAGKTVPMWARLRYFPPRELETIVDWETKIDRLAPASLAADVRAIGGTPSWLLLFFEKLAELRPSPEGRVIDWYPDLEMLVHGGVNFTPYRPLFARWLAGSGVETREVYPASEGFIAAADRGDGEGLRLVADNGLFYEFIPFEERGKTNPTRHWLATVETDVNYAIAVTTCAGLWSYLIGDTVRFIERAPPRLLVTGRTSYSLSAFGEHLIAEEIDGAVAEAAAAIGCGITDYAVGAVFPEREGELGGHLFIVEFSGGSPSPAAHEAFSIRLDAVLAAKNEDYASHRAGDYGMRPPTVHGVPPGTFAAWMKSRGRLGGQNKVPRVINDPELFAGLCAFVGTRR